MAKKSQTPMSMSGDFSPQALFLMKKKESELQLSSSSISKSPYRDFDRTPYIYADILLALNKQFGKKFKPVRLQEKTFTESSNYGAIDVSFIFPVLVNSKMYIFIECYDYNKATFGLQIDKKLYFSIVEKLKSFFSSNSTNKRSEFPAFAKSIEGVFKFKRFAHVAAKIWEQRIKEFIGLSPTNRI